jgi:hypothetical protein
MINLIFIDINLIDIHFHYDYLLICFNYRLPLTLHYDLLLFQYLFH